MSALQRVQLSSDHFEPVMLFSAFQQLGNTTVFNTFPASMGQPTAILGSGTANPSGLIDNRKLRATSLIMGFALTGSASASNCKVRLTAFSQIKPFSNLPAATGLWLPTELFNGVITSGTFACPSSIGIASAYLGDHFLTKTFATPYTNYIEPDDNSSAALILTDIRGFEFVLADFAQGGATASTYVQAFWGVN